MKIRWMRLSTWLMGIIGLTGCELINKEIACMYGVPTTHYKMNISVKDADGNPVEGIEVLNVPYFSEDPAGRTTTDKDGKAELSGTDVDISTNLVFNDIDGDANGGEFASDTVSVKGDAWKQIEKGDGAWDCGTYEATVDETLVKKQ